MALDAPTIAGLILGVLGLFGMSMMYKFGKRIWKSLVSEGHFLRAPDSILTSTESPPEHGRPERNLKRDYLPHLSSPK